jgi:hypothetical protein
MPTKLRTNKDGQIATCPVLGWTTGTVGGVAILLAIDYAETPEQIQTGGKSVQLVLTPQQSLELAEKLTTLANKTLDPTRSAGTLQ